MLMNDDVIPAHVSRSLPKHPKTKAKAKAKAKKDTKSKTNTKETAAPGGSSKECGNSITQSTDRDSNGGYKHGMKTSVIKRETSNAYKRAYKKAIDAGRSVDVAKEQARKAYARVAASMKTAQLKEI